MGHWIGPEAAQELMEILPLLHRLVAAEVRREAGIETTMPQFRALMHLASQPMTVSTLARTRRVSLQSMGELVQGLVERGWVERMTNPQDRRQQLLSLTEEGLRHYQAMQAYAIDRLVPLLEQLDEHEMQAVQIALPALHRIFTGDEDNS
jgi:DNA-binding MarR family transcriptional regulator